MIAVDFDTLLRSNSKMPSNLPIGRNTSFTPSALGEKALGKKKL